jgi:hypothetical protein
MKESVERRIQWHEGWIQSLKEIEEERIQCSKDRYNP